MTKADSAPERIAPGTDVSYWVYENGLWAGGAPEYIRAGLYESLTAERDAQAKQIEELKADKAALLAWVKIFVDACEREIDRVGQYENVIIRDTVNIWNGQKERFEAEGEK